MMEGGSAKEFSKAKALFYSNPQLFRRLMEKLTDAVTDFLQLQIDAGVDAIQIFDSLGGTLATGRVLNYRDRGDENRKLCSLYLSLMDRMGVKLERFGDGDTRLAGI